NQTNFRKKRQTVHRGSLTSLRRSDACRDRLFSNETIALAAGGNDETNRDTRSLRGRRMGEQERKGREIGLIRGDSDRGDLVENGSDTASSAWCTIERGTAIDDLDARAFVCYASADHPANRWHGD
ncbi:hypothetical protein K0M31_016671, partial [Melipona bicolor]